MSQRVSSNLETAELKTLNSITIHPRIYLRHHCNHLTKNVCFLSEIWNLKQIRDLAIANVAQFASLNAVFLSWAKNTTAWLYVTLTGHITIRHILEKMKAWAANQSICNTHSMILPLYYCFQGDVMVFLLENMLVGRVDSTDLINLVVTCSADCTCHHLTKNVYFLSEKWNLKQIRDLAIANVPRFASFNAVFLSLQLSKKYHCVVICHSDGTCNHPTYFGKKWKLEERTKA